MLLRLRFDGFIRRHHEQQEINAADSGQHVAHKALVARNIDKAQLQLLSIGGLQFEMSEADVDGNAAAFFFSQTVGVNAGERLHQPGLAVINVTRRAYDDRPHSCSLQPSGASHYYCVVKIVCWPLKNVDVQH